MNGFAVRSLFFEFRYRGFAPRAIFEILCELLGIWLTDYSGTRRLEAGGLC